MWAPASRVAAVGTACVNPTALIPAASGQRGVPAVELGVGTLPEEAFDGLCLERACEQESLTQVTLLALQVAQLGALLDSLAERLQAQ